MNDIQQEVQQLQASLTDSEACEIVLAALDPHMPKLQLLSLTNVEALPRGIRLHAAVAKLRARMNPP